MAVECGRDITGRNKWRGEHKLKDIVISEGRTAKTFYGVSKIHTPDTASGSVTWIPEDEADDYAHLGVKTITENGTYPAALDSLAGYSSVTVNVPTGAGGEGDNVFMDALETSVIDFICTPNLVQSGDTIGWRDGATHSFTCSNRSDLRGIWSISGTDLVFKEQHLVTASDYTTLTAMHVVECKIDGRQLYFTDIIDGDDPYGGYTFTSPTVRKPGISSDVAEMYKVYIRKASTEYEKVKFDISESSGTYNIRVLLGAGSSALSDAGKGIIEKDANGLSVSYVSRTDDTQRGIYIDDTATWIVEDTDKIGLKYVDTYPPETVDPNIIYFTPRESGS